MVYSNARSHTEPAYESRREREFYRYYEPIRNLSGDHPPPPCDPYNPISASKHVARSSPDRALTAFCQLGALRLNAERAMMFFFDSSAAYVLAEGTKTLSLENDQIHAEGDGLWLGQAVIPRGCAVCEQTSLLPPVVATDREASLHFVPDLSQDPAYRDRPFVAGYPYAKFYAGVPITTRAGINIGAYCILDPKPRDRLGEDAITFLQDVSSTIMGHLDMVRGNLEHRRAKRFMEGLSAFTGTTSVSESGASLQPHQLPQKADRLSQHSVAASDAASNDQEHLDMVPSKPGANSTYHDESHSGSAASRSIRSSKTNGTHTASSPTARANLDGDVTAGTDVKHVNDAVMAPNVRAVFQRAATMLLAAMEIDAVMMVDASISDRRTVAREGHDSSGSDQNPEHAVQTCAVLGWSCRLPPSSTTATTPSVEPQPPAIPQAFVIRILRRFPRGKCWTFNSKGETHIDAELSGTGSDSYDDSRLSHGTKEEYRRTSYGRKIQKLLPGVRSFGVVGLWSQEKQRSFAANIIWSYEPIHILSHDEINSVSAFGEVVMAEVHRLEMQRTEVSKVDFIASISHELRSPLYGIVGSVECLQERNIDDFSQSLVTQIDTCGRTLSDIIDHLLDFSKINYRARRLNRSDGQHHDRKKSIVAITEPLNPGFGDTAQSETSLTKLTEEVLGTVVYSFCCSKPPSEIDRRKVVMTYDVQCPAHLDWSSSFETGSWRRVCINLVSNALKYTTSGYIAVSLSVSANMPGSATPFEAILTVSDSGRGMSAEFLQHRLFDVFAQEDGMADGIGLGMSLVARIVKSLGGRISVQSTPDVGTSVKVSVPYHPQNRAASVESRSSRFSTGIIVLRGEEPMSESSRGTPRSLLLTSLISACKANGYDVVFSDSPCRPSAVARIILENDLEAWCDLQFGPTDGFGKFDPDVPIVVVCDTPMTQRRFNLSPPVHLARARTAFVTQPVGPHQLGQALNTCLAARFSELQQLGHLPPAIHVSANSAHPVDGSSDVADALSPLSIAQMGNGIQQIELAASVSEDRNNADHLDSTGISTKIITPDIDELAQPSPDPRSVNAITPLSSSLALFRQTMTDSPRSDVPPSKHPQADCGVLLLLVDDNEINLKILTTYAKKQGHPMLVARNGLEAAEKYQASCATTPSMPPAVILMDINMPIMSGFEATKRIRAFEREASLSPAHIVALSGRGDAAAQQEAYLSGMDRFMTKPVRFQQLTEMLRGIHDSGGS